MPSAANGITASRSRRCKFPNSIVVLSPIGRGHPVFGLISIHTPHLDFPSCLYLPPHATLSPTSAQFVPL